MEDRVLKDTAAHRAIAKVSKCAVCASTENLRFCKNCGLVRYCGEAHQEAHWGVHKKVCGKLDTYVYCYRLPDFACHHPWMSHVRLRQGGKNKIPKTSKNKIGKINKNKIWKINNRSSLSSKENSSIADNGGQLFDLRVLMDALDPDIEFNPTKYTTNNSQIGVRESCYETKDKCCSESNYQNQSPTISSATLKSPELACPSKMNSTCQENANSREEQEGSVQTQEEKETKEYITNERELVYDIVEHLKDYGYRIYDNFLGADTAAGLLEEVRALDASGSMSYGTLGSEFVVDKRRRSDKVKWVEKGDPGYPHISMLLGRLDALMVGCRHRLQKNIDGRSRAMVTCYPGDGAQFMRHVDNDDRDGTCITCVYYLNKDWDVKEKGGMLRLFPRSEKGAKVVPIEPIFDRQVFFWSDKRNPHEVQPCFDRRYAVTLWYYEARERTLANLKYQIEQMENVGAL